MKSSLLHGIFIWAVLTSIATTTKAWENIPPTACVDGSFTKRVCVGSSITLSGYCSYDDDGYIIMYRWWFDDGSPYQEGVQVNHTYSSAGIYWPSLEVIDDEYATDSDVCKVYVVEVASVTSNKETAVLCENITFTVTTNPELRPGYGDLISWSGGGIPATGSGSTFTTCWSCTGAKTVTATCGTSSKSKNVTISLPTGCSEGKERVIFQINPMNVTLDGCEENWGSGCGYTGLPEDIIEPDKEIDAVYNNCTWVFDVFAMQDVETGVCTGVHPDVIDISSGNDPDLTEDNYCGIVTSMRTEAGCTCIGLYMYTNSECAKIHEDYHAAYFQGELDRQAQLLLSDLPNIQIYCDDPNTITCQAVESQYSSDLENQIEEAFWWAWQLTQFSESGAIEEARPCFESLAQDICDYAAAQNWTYCDACE